MTNIHTIKDPRIRVKVSPDLIDILNRHHTHLTGIPESDINSLEKAGITISNVSKKTESNNVKAPSINISLLNDILAEHTVSTPSPKVEKSETDKNKSIQMYMYLNDLRWLSQALGILRSKAIVDVYLNDLLENCYLDLPKNEIVERNPELEARCQRLREEQQNLEYRKMTKNVDATLKHYPEDTVAYQSMYHLMKKLYLDMTLINQYNGLILQ